MDDYVARGEMEHFAQTVEDADVAAQGYTLSVSSYVEMRDEREIVDIDALNSQITQILAREAELWAEIDKIIAEIEG